MKVKEGTLRVWWIRNIPNKPDYFSVNTVVEAELRLAVLAENDLKDTSIESNAGGLEVYRDGDWEEWYDENGESIEDLMNKDD